MPLDTMDFRLPFNNNFITVERKLERPKTAMKILLDHIDINQT